MSVAQARTLFPERYIDLCASNNLSLTFGDPADLGHNSRNRLTENTQQKTMSAVSCAPSRSNNLRPV